MVQKTGKLLKPWHMGTHLRVLSESYPMNTNMTGLDGLKRTLPPCVWDESSLSIGRVNTEVTFVILGLLVRMQRFVKAI